MILYFFCGILFVFLLWNFLYAKYWRYHIDIRLHFVQEYVYAGEQAVLEEIIENRKRMPIPVFEAAFHTKKELLFSGMENTNVSDYTYKRDVFALLGFQRITRRLDVDCTKRGFYEITEAEGTSFSLLYGKRYSFSQAVDTRLYVYAKRVDVSRLLLTCEQMMGARQCDRKLYEDPFAFRSIREYTITDPMKTINWKASAKTGGLMVNTFESTLTESIMIYLDIEDRGILKYEELIEDSISVAASVAYRMLESGMQVGLAVDKIYIEPAGGKGQSRKIEQMLAMLQTEHASVPFGEVLSQHPQDSFSILISKNMFQYVSEVEKFATEESSGVCVVPFPRGMHQETEQSIRRLGSFPVIDREVARC